jgi:cell wall-associated protease
MTKTISFLALATALLSTVALGQGERDFFYANHKKVSVLVLPDRVGAIGRDRVTGKQVRAFAESMGLDLAQEFSGGMFILQARPTAARPPAADRASALKLAREVRRRGGDLFRDVGIVVQVEGETTPRVVTDEFIAQFKPGVTKGQIESFNKSHGVDLVRQERFVKNQFVLRVMESTPEDALQMTHHYEDDPSLVFAQPNFWSVYALNETVPNDALFANQWHHRNTGASGGTTDADADTSMAWDITQGTAATVIAIVDNGFDLTHEDLAANLFTNPAEVPGNGVDDDGNGFIDDVHGWDFINNDNDPSPVSAGDNHGTAVTGVAVAQSNNTVGVSGACPNCRFLPLNVFSNCSAFGCTSNTAAFADAINYAAAMGARIISNSWGQTSTAGTAETAIVNAINNASAAGALVFFAGGNQVSSGWCNASYPSLVNVFAVSSSTNQDRHAVGGGGYGGSATGNCIDILSPSWHGDTGTLGITTTDRTGAAGYNSGNSLCIGTLTEPTNTNYTSCFGGTSSATPLASGIAGLVLSANPGLTRVQLQRLLQDTADKIEDSVAAYSDATGFSSPASGTATHSWGRINAFESVRIAAPLAQGGKAGVDIFLRDNRLDWGNTEQPSNVLFEPTRGFIGHWQSMDIKVDAPPYQTAPTAATFDAFTDETPSAVSGDVNRVYVRVRNRGPVTASSVTVKLHWTQFGTALPTLPPDFWTAFPADSTDTTQWHPLGVRAITDLEYSGASVAGCPGRAQPSCGVDLDGDGDTSDAGETSSDAAQVVEFDFPAPAVDPSKPNHFCLLAMVDSPQDPISPASKASFIVDNITPTDNNVTHRNYHDLNTTATLDFAERFFVRNPTNKAVQARLVMSSPRGWRVDLDKLGFDKPFELKPGEETLVTAKVTAPEPGQTGTVTIVQQQVGEEKVRIMGGLTLGFRPLPILVPPPSPLLTPYLIGTWDLREARTLLHILNPTGHSLLLWVAFFDDNEKPLRCVREKLSPNDLLELDVAKALGKVAARFGVVKVVSFDPTEERPEVGIAGNQRILFLKPPGATETGLHPVPYDVLQGDLKYIEKICR